ncbi:hypothetical protein GCM10010492_54660 [Saccharothrix mutabilis subsp. mutabilis]|uniref:Htaa domain-containing protein n=1 Tax=Saccharothrix mutabilis subsp. mutabilis TaxID=66855 RepID=A0ABN0UEL8_9PSEU
MSKRPTAAALALGLAVVGGTVSAPAASASPVPAASVSAASVPAAPVPAAPVPAASVPAASVPGQWATGGAWAKFFQGRTDLTLDPTAAAALTSLGVDVKPFFARSRDGVISFAVVGDPGDGTIEHVGGLVLRAGHTRLFLTDYTIDLDRGVLTGLVGFRQRAELFTLGAATPQGVTLALTPAAAQVLNSTFGVTAFTAGLVIGYGNPVLR